MIHTVIVDGKEYESKRYTWEELVDMFPEKWVILDDITFDHSDIVDGILVGVCKDGEKNRIEEENVRNNKIYSYFRTEVNVFSTGLMGVV